MEEYMKGTVFITGASSGFGKACARRFGQEGWRLILAARRREQLEQLQAEFGADNVHILSLDVREREAVANAVAFLPEEFSQVDLLVASAGLAQGLEPAQRAYLDDWETMVDTNIKGLMYTVHAILPGMVARNKGQIITMGSTAGNWPYPGGNCYGGTKAFVKKFAENLRADLLGTRVRVTNIEPGMAETEFSLVRFKGDHDRSSQVYQGTEPLTAEDIADIVWWVSSRPAHVNVNSLEVMSIDQAWGPYAIHREEKTG
jgi:3-hydroxy acid dehydrogenase / malonic semialdehyde reductase